MSEDKEVIRNDESLIKRLGGAMKTEGVLVKLDDISEYEKSATQQWVAFGKLLTEAHAERQTGLPPDLT